MSDETGMKRPIVTVYILKKRQKNPINTQRTAPKTGQKTPKVTPFRTPKTAPTLGTALKSALLTPYASHLCTDRQTDRQTYIVVNYRSNLLLSYAREKREKNS